KIDKARGSSRADIANIAINTDIPRPARRERRRRDPRRRPTAHGARRSGEETTTSARGLRGAVHAIAFSIHHVTVVVDSKTLRESGDALPFFSRRTLWKRKTRRLTRS